MSYKNSLSFVLLACAIITVPLQAETPGTVTGALTLNGTKYTLTHIYGRKREAWPADAKALDVENLDELSCGIVELIMTNTALSEATIASILQNEYHGSDKIRGVRLVIDGSGKHEWANMFLLESGVVKGYGVTQSNGEITGGQRFAGKVSCQNEEVTQVRMFDVTFDTPVKEQYTRTETENAKKIPDASLADEFLKTLPGEWKIERWLGLGCMTASGKLVVGERVSPRAFQAMFYITTSNGDEIEEDATISISGTKVHVEGGKVRGPENVWLRDVLDFELWENLMVGSTETDFVVLRKKL